jgi:hypothetical protein
MSEPLDETYFKWLYSQVADPGVKSKTLAYWKVLRVLHEKEFVWVVENDENRIADGKILREEFLDATGYSVDDPDWIELGCSMLELLVGLAKRLDYDSVSVGPHYWFWVHLMHNIGLSQYNDASSFDDCDVEDILDRVIYRSYEFDGSGGLFPLKHPKQDQRRVELWYQMAAYVMEHEQET